jgi:poly(glycerol-phosphate) alpha-glucosyltransferase
MLDPWAVRNAAWKKRIAATLYENAHLKKAPCLHALCRSEARAIRDFGLKNPICVLPNGVEIPQTSCSEPPPWDSSLPAGANVLLYLGRIHPKKGLRELVMAWQKAIKSRGIGSEWFLVIAGWDQGGHENELKSLVSELGVADRILFVGPQFDVEKQQTFARAQAFILPSFSEGLPMVVLEAMAHALPVLMTPYCNLPEVFKAGAAFRIEPEVAPIAGTLGELGDMTEEERKNIGKKGLQLVSERFTWGRIAQEMRSVYGWLLEGGEVPHCVRLQ